MEEDVSSDLGVFGLGTTVCEAQHVLKHSLPRISCFKFIKEPWNSLGLKRP